MSDKAPGLSYTSSEEAPRVPEITADTTGGGALPVKMTSKGPVVSGNTTANNELLKNMEAFLAERNSPMARIQKGLEQAAAWAVPNTEGQKSVALNALATRQNKEAEDIYAQQSNLATMKAALKQQELFDKARMAGNADVGGGGGLQGKPGAMTYNGVTLPEELQAIYTAPGLTKEKWDKEFNTWAQNTMKERSSAASQTQQAYRDPESGAIIGYFTPAQWAQREAAGARGVKAVTPTVPAMRAQITNADDAARVGARESGNNPNIGYHNPEKGTAYGTYGITKAAYQDIQNAIPKFKDRDITTLTADEQTEAFGAYRKLATAQLTKLGVEPTKQSIDLASFLGPTGAAEYIKTGKISEEAAANNGGSTKAKVIADGILAGQPVATSRAETTSAAAPAKAATVASPGLSKIEQHDLDVKRAQDALANQTAEGKASSEATGKATGERQTALESAANTARTNVTKSEQMRKLQEDYPEAFGLLDKPGVISSVGKALETGIDLPLGMKAHIPGMEDVMANATLSKDAYNARKAYDSYAQDAALAYRKDIMKGTGAVSDMETKLASRAQGLDKSSPAEANRIFLKLYEERQQLAKVQGDNWEKYQEAEEAAGRKANYRQFERSEGYKKPIDDMNKRLEKDLPLKKSEAGSLKSGDIVDGHKFKGGNPADKSNWEKV